MLCSQHASCRYMPRTLGYAFLYTVSSQTCQLTAPAQHKQNKNSSADNKQTAKGYRWRSLSRSPELTTSHPALSQGSSRAIQDIQSLFAQTLLCVAMSLWDSTRARQQTCASIGQAQVLIQPHRTALPSPTLRSTREPSAWCCCQVAIAHHPSWERLRASQER